MTTAQLNGNGQPKGRAAPDPATFVFANGAVATLRPISQFTQAHIEIQCRKKFPPPDPPLNEVDYGDGIKKLEPNKSDPDHEAAMQRYTAELSSKVFEAMVHLGVEVEVDQAALDRVKADLEFLKLPMDEISDKVAYIKHCCMFDIQTEGAALAKAMNALIGPREEDVADHIATFPGNVQRA